MLTLIPCRFFKGKLDKYQSLRNKVNPNTNTFPNEKKCFFNQKVIKFCLFMNKSSVYDHALTLLNENNIIPCSTPKIKVQIIW